METTRNLRLIFLIVLFLADIFFTIGFKPKITNTILRSALGFGFYFCGYIPTGVADARQIGDIPTSGLIFKDSLRVSSFKDPKIPNVNLYLADFDRPLTDKLNSNFFDDPSSSSLACSSDGPIDPANLQKITPNKEGEEIFEESRNLFFKQIKVRRIYDKDSNTLVYVSYSTRFDKNADENKSRFKSSLCAVSVNK